MAPITICRACTSTNLYTFLPLGNHPPANAFLSSARLSQPETAFALDTQVCLDCGVVVVSDQLPSDFFGDYVYVPSASETMHEHFADFARQVRERYAAGPRDLVVDIGCNDGLFLGRVQAQGGRTLGVEPAANIAVLAREKGILVENVYFGPETAADLRASHGPATVITTTNTFNHIDDLHGFMRGVDAFLAPDGVFIVEVPQALTYVEHNEFDTVYHEHLSTFSVTSLAKLYAFFGMRIVDVQALSIHGGSMRVVARRAGPRDGETAVAQAWMDRERAAGLFERATYDRFADRVHRIRDELLAMLRGLKTQGKSIAAYGAPAKGNTLLNYYDIGPELLDFLADRNTLKQGKYSPGKHIPVVAAERVVEAQPDYLLILAWNFGDEIMQQQAEYRRRGGQFILPIPEPRIVA